MRLRVFVYAALFAFAPLISFLAGGIYLGVLEKAFHVKCMVERSSSLCTPGEILVLGGFMPAVMIFTIPAAVVFVVGYVVRAAWRSRDAVDTGQGDG